MDVVHLEGVAVENFAAEVLFEVSLWLPGSCSIQIWTLGPSWSAAAAIMVEYVALRRDWGRYVELVTEVRRSLVSDADEFLVDMRTRIEHALQRRTR